MTAQGIERRQNRRVDMGGVRVEFRAAQPAAGSREMFVGDARNVGPSGVFAQVPAPFPLQAGTVVTCSATIPPSAIRQFPFSRILGTGTILRVIPEGDQADRVGVAIAFAPNVTVLGTIEAH